MPLRDAFRPLPPSQAVREARRERRVMLRRSIAGRCPLCATKGIRSGCSTISDRCPGCNFALSRERGYLSGAATVATVVVVPSAFQPFAVALWLWVGLAYFRPLDASDLSANDPQSGRDRPV